MILRTKTSQVREAFQDIKNTVIIDLKSQACRSSLINLSTSLFSILANLTCDLCCFSIPISTHMLLPLKRFKSDILHTHIESSSDLQHPFVYSFFTLGPQRGSPHASHRTLRSLDSFLTTVHNTPLTLLKHECTLLFLLPLSKSRMLVRFSCLLPSWPFSKNSLSGYSHQVYIWLPGANELKNETLLVYYT